LELLRRLRREHDARAGETSIDKEAAE